MRLRGSFALAGGSPVGVGLEARNQRKAQQGSMRCLPGIGLRELGDDSDIGLTISALSRAKMVCCLHEVPASAFDFPSSRL